MKETSTAKFIAELRKEKGLTQEQLAKEIHISRAAITKWETNRGTPDVDSLQLLSDYFKVSINEILNGKRNEKDSDENKEIDSLIVSSMKSEKNLYIKKIRNFSIITFFAVTLIFLSLYFITSYNSVKGYSITANSDKFEIFDGILLTSKMKNYLYLGKINSLSDEIDTESNYLIDIFYIENEQEHVVLHTDNSRVVFIEKYGYEEYLTKELFNHLEDLLIKISYIDKKGNLQESEMKLKVKLTFANKKLVYIKNGDINNPEDERTNFNDENELILKLEKLGYQKSKTSNEEYELNAKDTKYIYDIYSKEFTVYFGTKSINNTIKISSADKIYVKINLDKEAETFQLDSIDKLLSDKRLKNESKIVNEFLEELEKIQSCYK